MNTNNSVKWRCLKVEQINAYCQYDSTAIVVITANITLLPLYCHYRQYDTTATTMYGAIDSLLNEDLCTFDFECLCLGVPKPESNNRSVSNQMVITCDSNKYS